MSVNPQETNTNKTDITDLYIAMRPLLSVMNFLGINHNTCRAQWKKRLHSVLVLIFLWILAILLVATRFSTVYLESFAVANVADVTALTTFLILATCNLISAFSSSTATKECLEIFNLIDSLLCIDKSILYKKGRTTVNKLMIFYMTTVSFIIFFEILSSENTLLFIIDYILYYLNAFVLIYFITVMYFLKTKFFILNVELQAWCQTCYKDRIDGWIDGNVPRKQKLYISRSNLENYIYSCHDFEKLCENACISKKLEINNLIDVYLYSCEQADLINFLFSIQNLLTIKYGFFSIIRIFNYAASGFLNVKNYSGFGSCLSNMLFSLYDLINILLVLSSCEFVKSEAKKTAIHLDTILNRHLEFIEERDKLESWIQLTTRRFPQFTACGFFNLDLGLFYSLIGTIFTYIIILMQLK